MAHEIGLDDGAAYLPFTGEVDRAIADEADRPGEGA